MSPALGSLGPKGEEDAARAEQLHLAQLARQAQEGNVFFQTAGSGRAAVAQPVTDTMAPSTKSAVAPSAEKESPSRVSLDTDHDQNGQQHKIDFANQRSDDAIQSARGSNSRIIGRGTGRIANPG